MSDLISPDSIREQVRSHYAAQARQAESCCGPAYPAEQIQALPADIAGFSLGCGSPFAAAALRPGETVVDLGSGAGLDCFLAAREVGPAGHVIGVDMTPDMLARARANARRLGAANVEFREGYIEALPLGQGEADVILSNCVINLSPDKPQVFREMFRVLKPGGRVAVSDVVVRGGQLPEALRQDMLAWSACVAGALPEAEYQAGLEAAGFEQVRVEPKGEFEIGQPLPAGVPYSAIITARKPER